MNVVLTGATGFVGGEVLSQLVLSPRVERVTCLARRLPAGLAPQVVPWLHQDFTRFDEAAMGAVADHGACIWALGGKAADITDPAALERVTHGFTLAFAEALARRVAPSAPLTFCYVSGMGADPSESSRLPWERETRHLKGRTEKDLLALAARTPGLRVVCFRPGGILPRGASPWLLGLLAPLAIGVEELGRGLVRAALEPPALAMLGNAAIKRWARADASESGR